MPKIDIVFAAREQLDARQAQVVVIDVLRATSTMVTALHNGCREIIPVASLSEALALAACSKEVLLAGERNTQKPAHFDLGNSPLEFTAQRVGGKRIVLTTTNGTRALRSIHNARETILASFLNFDSVKRYLLRQPHDILFYCAGNDGRFSFEDTLCASLLIDRLKQSNGEYELSDAAQWALHALSDLGMGKSPLNSERLLTLVSSAAHAQRLAALHLHNDIAYCCQLNRFELIPFFDGANSIKSKNL